MKMWEVANPDRHNTPITPSENKHTGLCYPYIPPGHVTGRSFPHHHMREIPGIDGRDTGMAGRVAGERMKSTLYFHLVLLVL